MFRFARRAAPLLLLLTLSCAAPSELARRSEAALGSGDRQRAWELAVKALDREPGNARARAAAGAAARAIADDWTRRIRTVADVDTLAAAGQVVEFASFRARAVAYAPLAVDSAWAGEERDLRRAAARIRYGRGVAALGADRPKSACGEFAEVERFVPGYRDVARLAQKARDQATTWIAFLPLRATAGDAALGREVAAAWRDAIAGHLAGSGARFTRVLPAEQLERVMTVAEMRRMSREEAVHLARRAGAGLVVWGVLGGTRSDTRTDRFDDVVVRRVTEKRPGRADTVRWVDVPVLVVARERSVTTGAEVEVVATDDEITVARLPLERSLTARTLWTAEVPQDDPGDYQLLTDPVRSGDPERARRVEARWKSVVGERTSVKQVFQGVRGARGHAAYRRDQLPRFHPGAQGPVFLDDLPPVDDLAFAALGQSWQPLMDELLRLDEVDLPDLVPGEERSE